MSVDFLTFKCLWGSQEATRISDALAVYGSVRRSGDGARLAGTPGDGDEQAAPGVEQKAKNRKPSSVPPCPTAKHGQAKKRDVLKSWQK